MLCTKEAFDTVPNPWAHIIESTFVNHSMIYALVCKNWKWKKTCIQIDCLLIGTGPDDHLGAVRLSKESQLDVALRNVCLLDTIDNDRSQPSAKPRYEHWWTYFYFIWLCQGKNVLGGCAFLVAKKRIKTIKSQYWSHLMYRQSDMPIPYFHGRNRRHEPPTSYPLQLCSVTCCCNIVVVKG